MATFFFTARTDVRSEKVGFVLMGGGVSKRFVLMTGVHSSRWAQADHGKKNRNRRSNERSKLMQMIIILVYCVNWANKVNGVSSTATAAGIDCQPRGKAMALSKRSPRHVAVEHAVDKANSLQETLDLAADRTEDRPIERV
jgi:hypothetical protein